MQGEYREILPSELMDVGVPVWGDKLVIDPSAKASLTFFAHPEPHKIVLGYLPTSPASGTSIRLLLKAATKTRMELTRQCAAGPLSHDEAENVAVHIKTSLEHYRSILDYLAHDIYSLCRPTPGSRKPRKLYFPNAGPNETNADFHKRFQKEYPQLRNTAPKLFRYIIDIQRFSGETWLNDLVSLVNPMKHHRLAEWEEIDCSSLTIHYKGIGVRLGELGLKCISIPKDHEVRFRFMDVERAIRGPQEIDVTTKKLTDADPEVAMDRHTWRTTAIKGTGRSIAGLLAEIDGGVRHICLEVTRAIHPSPTKP
jgi:hypothetical protein